MGVGMRLLGKGWRDRVKVSSGWQLGSLVHSKGFRIGLPGFRAAWS